MYKAKSLPSINVNYVVEQINKYMDSHRKKRHSEEVLTAYKEGKWLDILKADESLYIKNGDSLHSITKNLCQQDDIGGVNNQTMEDLYKDFFDSNFDLRSKLYKSFPIGCPICDTPWGYAEEHLDHILPKSSFPQYAITPVNLVRTCGKCNRQKSSKFGTDEHSKIVNPYFRSINFVNKLSCYTYVESSEIMIEIVLKKIEETGLSEEDYDSLKYFLETYKLLDSYTMLTHTSILTKIIDSYIDPIMYKNIGLKELRELLISRRNSINYDFIKREQRVTDKFLEYILLNSLIENLETDLYKVIIKRIENRRKELHYE